MRTRLSLFLRERTGAAALEMAFIAPIFIMMLLMGFDLGYMLFNQSVLDGAVRNAARIVRTGQSQTSGDTGGPAGIFMSTLDASLQGIISPSKVAVYVQNYSSFSALKTAQTTPPALFDTSGVPTGPTFNAGNPNDAVIVRIGYIYKFMVPWEGSLLFSVSPGQALLQSTVVFKNEPYPTPGG